MYKALPYILFIASLLATQTANTQTISSLTNNFQFDAYTTDNGLTDNFISKVITDRRGFLWIATKNGLSRYDGYNFKNYTHIPGDTSSLRSIWITDLLLDSAGTLWISTEGGLCYYDALYDRFHYINGTDNMHVLYRAPLCQGSDAYTLWLAAEDGLFRIDTRTKTYTHMLKEHIPDPQCIVYDKNRLLTGTRTNGIYAFEAGSKQLQKLAIPTLPADAQTIDLYKDDDGTIYAGTNAGLLSIRDTSYRLFNKGTPELQHLDFDDIMCISSFPRLTGPGRLICGTYDNKVLVFDKQQQQFIYSWQNRNSKLSNMPRGIFSCLFLMDHILWIGTDHGLFKLNMNMQDIVSENIPQIMFGDNIVLVKKIYQDPHNKQHLWLTLDKPVGGIAVYNTTQRRVTQWLQTLPKGESPEACVVYQDLQPDKQGYLWAIAEKEIHQYQLTSFQRTAHTPPRTCYSASVDHQQNLWIGTDRGLMYYNTHTRQFTPYDYSFNGTSVENSSLWLSFPVQDIQHDQQHTVWLTCIKYGLFSFNTQSCTYTPHRQPFTSCYDTRNRCSSLSFDQQGNIWVGTMAGLTQYLPQRDSFINFNRTHGLQSTYVYSVKADTNQCIWGRGNTGVFYYDMQQHKFTNYLLPASQSSAFFLQRISAVSDKMLAGYEGGYNIFALNNRNPVKETPPDPYIARCYVMNAPFYYNSDSILLQPPSFDYHQTLFRFDFSAVNFNDNNNITFLYKLQGLDKDWQRSSGPSNASYSNLKPGQYLFLVKTRNSNGIESGVAGFLFTIQTPFWQTGWFYTLIGLAIVGVFYVFYRTRINRLTALYQLRSKISKDLHDDIGAALSSISIMSAVAQKKIDSQPEEAKHVATRIESTSRNMVGAISDMVWSINPDIDTLEQIIVRLREYMSNMFDDTRTQYLLHCTPQLLARKISMELRKDIYLISKEIINNTVKYADAEHFSLHFSMEKNCLVIASEDDGVGFNQEHARKGNGLYNITERARKQKGKAVISTDDSGTRWLIKMDIGR